MQTADTKPAKVSIFSSPGSPNIPALVRTYGTITRLANAAMIILSVLALLLHFGTRGPTPSSNSGIFFTLVLLLGVPPLVVLALPLAALMNLAHSATSGSPALGFSKLLLATPALGYVCQIIIGSIWFFVGGLLRDGHKSGVLAVSVGAAFQIAVGLVIAAISEENGVIIAMVVIIGVSVILGPLLVVAHKHWEKFD